MSVRKNDYEMELELMRKDLTETKELVRDIKHLLVGNERLSTSGIIQEFEEAKGMLELLQEHITDITNKVKHIFKWRDDYVAGKKEYKAWKTERFRWTFQNIWSVISTVLAVILGLKELGVI